MPFATPLPSGILASGVKSNCTGGTTETIGALATGALATGGRATGKLTAGPSGGALVSGAFEATTLTLASLEPFLAFGFALAWKKTEKLVTENEAFVLLFWHVMRVMTSLQKWSLISCIPTTLQSKKDVRNWLATVRCCEKWAPSLANWLRLLRKCDVAWTKMSV